tara:strand:- start:95 stop:3748 length:3654 start_codon:yes stop_codon:yes gene_type:complete
MSFVHLLNHSEYSMLQATCRTNDILSKAIENNQVAAALTDNGNMFGVLEFYFTAIKKLKGAIKPLLGCQIYVDAQSSGQSDPYHHDRLVLIASNQDGYQSLTKIVTYGHLEGFDQKPLVTLDVLRANSKGLIVLYGGIDSLYAKHILHDKKQNADHWIKSYQDIYSYDDFYLMLQDHGLPEEKTLLKATRISADERQAQLVVTNSNHYVTPDDHDSHKILRCIEKKIKLKDFDQMVENGSMSNDFPTNQYYLKSTEEMESLFPNDQEALANTGKIAERCQINLREQPEIGDTYWPKYEFPEGFNNSDDYLAHFTWSKVHERYAEVTEAIKDRINTELRIMKEMKVSGYMLIVQDFINWARDQDIPVGPGRGSAVGSVVCYIAGIVDIDPLKFDLLFERFLNPERVSMPDIDTDFSDKDREKVIKYVTDHYGADCVSQVVTYGRLKAKAVLKDVGRVRDKDHNEINALTKFLPALLKGLKRPASKALPPGTKGEEYADDFDEIQDAFVKSGAPLRDVWLDSLKLEGLVRQPGIHAAAVIIAPKPLVELAPLYKAPGDDAVVIQYDKTYAEDVGFLKMDFLGLRNLSVIKDTVALIKEQRGIEVIPSEIDVNDTTTYELLGRGLTVGVFQFESGGMQNYLRQLKPTNLEDMIAMNALYRPGPIAQIPNFIKRKKDPSEVDCYHTRLENILGDTYGIIVYQEQVMLIAQQMSGFSLGGADILRRIMAKKKPEAMAIEEPKFIGGALDNGYPEDVARKIWEDLGPFCAYAFNKSHSAAYAYIGYQTAFLKAHYGPEFMAANMSSEIDSTERLVILLDECKNIGIEIYPPSINQSKTLFSVLDGKINYGLAGIKNVGQSFIDALVSERNKDGEYTSLFNLVKRLATCGQLNRKALESLVMAGALDCVAGNRAQQYASIDLALTYAVQVKKDVESGQFGLFDEAFGADESGVSDEPELKRAVPWTEVAVLDKEKEVMGLFVTGHPLETVQVELKGFTTGNLSPGQILAYPISEKPKYGKIRDNGDDTGKVILGGYLSRMNSRMNKNNKAFAFGALEDFFGNIEVCFWPEVYEDIQGKFEQGSMVLIEGRLEFKKDMDTKQPTDVKQLIAEKMIAIEDARLKWTKFIHVRIPAETFFERDLKELEYCFEAFEGDDTGANIVFHITTGLESGESGSEHTLLANKRKKMKHPDEMGPQFLVTPESELLGELKDLLGPENVWISKTF